MQNKEWFKEWFNSEYYHILYKNRDDKEAELFLDNLSSFLKINANSNILDLACGRGRHAIYLNKKGFNVTGVDYSNENILFAKKHENENLHFLVHDMRNTIEFEKFDYILNLFTSFGYFDTPEEDLSVLVAIKNALMPNGLIVLDFHNTTQIIEKLVIEEQKVVEGIKFVITRELKNGFLYKNIEVKTVNNSKVYYEKVRAIYLSDFLILFQTANLKINNIFGNYDLEPFDENKSERMIFILSPL